MWQLQPNKWIYLSELFSDKRQNANLNWTKQKKEYLSFLRWSKWVWHPGTQTASWGVSLPPPLSPTIFLSCFPFSVVSLQLYCFLCVHLTLFHCKTSSIWPGRQITLGTLRSVSFQCQDPEARSSRLQSSRKGLRILDPPRVCQRPSLRAHGWGSRDGILQINMPGWYAHCWGQGSETAPEPQAQGRDGLKLGKRKVEVTTTAVSHNM